MPVLITVAETPEYIRCAERLLPAADRMESGGVRVIYYFHGDAMPLYLLTVFGKNEKDNLSKAERNELAGLVAILKSTAGNLR
jgi:hypothetical protein